MRYYIYTRFLELDDIFSERRYGPFFTKKQAKDYIEVMGLVNVHRIEVRT
jgi:hypothetical protein